MSSAFGAFGAFGPSFGGAGGPGGAAASAGPGDGASGGVLASDMSIPDGILSWVSTPRHRARLHAGDDAAFPNRRPPG
jgi:hypothetical protein